MRSGRARLTTIAVFAFALVAVAQAGLSALTPVSAPEIDGSSLPAGLALLAAGAIIVRARMRSK